MIINALLSYPKSILLIWWYYFEYALQYDEATDSVPMPMVLIEQDLDSDATIVQLSFGDRLGALIDTVRYMFLELHAHFWRLDFIDLIENEVELESV